MLNERGRHYRVHVDQQGPAPADDLASWATGRLLSHAARLVEHDWNLHLSRWELNHASLAVLHVLGNGALTQHELAAELGVEDQTVSRTLEKLERCGYVRRARDRADRRRVRVALTPLGRSTYASAADRQRAEEHFAEVGDVAALREGLVAVIRARSRQRWGPDRSGPGRPDQSPDVV